jgi:hypothetical protein
MTDPQPDNMTEFEQATSRTLPQGAPLDNETAELRDGWLALGRSLDVENAGFREEDLLARLLTDSESPLVAPRPLAASRERFWPALLASALALAILVAGVRFWFTNESDERLAGNAPASGQGDDTATIAAEWSDPLDDELNAAAYRVRTLVAQGTVVDDSLVNLADHMESMSDELIHSSL